MRAQYQPTIRFQVLAQVAVEAAEYIRGQCTVAQECIRHTVVEAAVVAAAAVEAEAAQARALPISLMSRRLVTVLCRR